MRADVRHNLKHDRFAETVTGAAGDTYAWAGENTRNLVIAAVIAVIVLGGAIGGWYWYQQQQDKANVALGHAIATYNTPLRPAGTPPMPGIESFSSLAERGEAARREFSSILEKYPRTTPGHLAQYFIGVTYKDEGKFNEAEAALKKAADAGDKDAASLAKYALAQVYTVSNRNADAVKTYKDLIDHPTNSVTKESSEFDLAALYESTQQPAEAVKIYEQVKKDAPKSAEAQFADQKLAALKAAK